MNRFAALLVIGATPVLAQRPVVSAESGVYAEAYSIDSRAPRRPGQSARFFASPTFSWMGFDVGTQLMWSTENEFTAQTLNRYYLNPRWSWGQLHGGDYTPSISRYTASAVTVRGGGVELTPGRFRVAATGGLAQDATNLSAFDAAPRRTMFAGLLGFGDQARSFVELSAMRVVDDSSGTDSLSVAPQENVTGAVSAGILIGRVLLKGEFAASLFSRDTRASELDSMSTPGASGGMFTPRVSSRFDQAYSAEVRLGLPNGSIGVQLEEIGPGFTTLGNPYMPNDNREVKVLGTYRLMNGRLASTAALGVRNDNLAGDKRGTTTRRTGMVGVTALTGAWLVSSASILLNGLTLDPAPLPPGTPDPGIIDSFRLRNISRSIALTEQARFRAMGLPQTVTLSLSAQEVNDDSPRFGELLDASALSVVGDWSVTMADRLTLSLRPGFDRFGTNDGTESYASVGLGATRRAPRSRWTAGVLATHTQVRDGYQLRGNANAGVRLTARDQLTLSFRHSLLRGVADPFTETMGSMRLTRRW